MVPNPDPKQYWNNWKNDILLFSATNQEKPSEQLLHNCIKQTEVLNWKSYSREAAKYVALKWENMLKQHARRLLG